VHHRTRLQRFPRSGGGCKRCRHCGIRGSHWIDHASGRARKFVTPVPVRSTLFGKERYLNARTRRGVHYSDTKAPAMSVEENLG